MRRLSTGQADFEARLAELLAFEAAQDPQVDATVAAILADVKARGDAAVLEYTARFDGVTARTLAELEIPRSEMQAALARIPAVRRAALETAAARVRDYHQRQRAQSWGYTD
ncbi:MAG: histidinol dehydrogenase, partial [Proteobacteria bacterium]|nr:histidinol dehydrogenase [Pseudomonadota bacterium]